MSEDQGRRGQRIRDAVKRVKLAVDRLEAARANPEAVEKAVKDLRADLDALDAEEQTDESEKP
jgi:hypothetical protein